MLSVACATDPTKLEYVFVILAGVVTIAILATVQQFLSISSAGPYAESCMRQPPEVRRITRRTQASCKFGRLRGRGTQPEKPA